MSRYTFPCLSSFEIIFNGRRYKAFKVSMLNPFKGYEEDSDFVIWDGLYDAAVAYGTITVDNLYCGFLAFSHVEIEVDPASCIRDFVKNTRRTQERFFRDSGT